MTKEKNYIFIGGVPRSGTTLLQNMLGAHPEVCALPEFAILFYGMKVKEKFHKYIDNRALGVICSHQEVNERIKAFFSSFLDPLFAKYNKKYICEKTPENILIFNDLIELFPESHFIHIIRDPRAVIASLLQVGVKARLKGRPPNYYTCSVRDSIEFTRKCLDSGFAANKKFPGKVYTIVYENLVKNPKEESMKLCEHLGIEWNESILNPKDAVLLNEKNMTCEQNSHWYNTEMYKRNPTVENIATWKEGLNNDDQVRITKAFMNHQELLKLGYDFSLDHLTKIDRISGEMIAQFRQILGNWRMMLSQR